jgi:hypothetical protein
MKYTSALFILMAAACAPPTLSESPGNPPASARISGTVTVAGGQHGDVYLFLVPQTDLSGQCRAEGRLDSGPANLVRIPGTLIFQTSDATTHSAPFTIPQVPLGCWSIFAVLDADDSFNPLFSVTSGTTEGDLAGASLTAAGAPRVFEIQSPEDGPPAAVEGVQVLIGQVVPFDPPSFTFSNLSDNGPASLRLRAEAPTQIRLETTSISGDWLRTGDQSGGPFFPIRVDPESGAVTGTDVFLRRLKDRDEAQGGAPWALDTDFPLILPARINPDTLIVQPTENGPFLRAEAFSVDVYPLGFLPPTGSEQPEPLPLSVWQDRAEEGLNPSPSGRYAVVARIAATNQLWQVPNALSLLHEDPTQATVFVVAAE